ncbi:MAG: hypothetical protein KDA60_13865 [Planctomycetales bacterium]|nr:hypothetical protein [Planctomycetales bacterium]
MCKTTPIADATAPPGTLRRSARPRITVIVLLGLVAIAWLIGQLFRDRYWVTGVAFYIPSVAVALLAALVCLWERWRGRVTLAIVALLFAMPPSVMAFFVENHGLFRGPTDDGEALSNSYIRLVHWNVCWGRIGWPSIVDRLEELQPDIVVISERPAPELIQQLLDRLGPEFHVFDHHKVSVVARGDMDRAKCLLQVRNGEVYVSDWHYAGRSLRIMTADLASSIMLHRDPLLKEVMGFVDQHQPDLVVGDFNAPRRSRHLSQLPTGYCHAYDAVGRGSGYTWPVPFPVYSLDQLICRSEIVPRRYRLLADRGSDHCGQVFDFQWNQASK